MKVCKECGCEYEFYGQKGLLCKSCKRAYDRNHYAKQSPEAKERKQFHQKIRYDAARQYIWDYLLINPCISCNESDPVVLEFDHIDRNSKFKVVSDLCMYSISKIKKEIEKCRVLCANCHRRHTANQLGWYNSISK